MGKCTMTPQEFVENHNRIAKWNKEIRDSLYSLYSVEEDEKAAERLLDEILPVEEIGCTVNLQGETVEDRGEYYELKGLCDRDIYRDVFDYQLFKRDLNIPEHKYKMRILEKISESSKAAVASISENVNKMEKDRLALKILISKSDIIRQEIILEQAATAEESFETFRSKVVDLVKKRPEGIRYGQSVYNAVYRLYPGLCYRAVSSGGPDCFYEDKYVEGFLEACWREILEIKRKLGVEIFENGKPQEISHPAGPVRKGSLVRWKEYPDRLYIVTAVGVKFCGRDNCVRIKTIDNKWAALVGYEEIELDDVDYDER